MKVLNNRKPLTLYIIKHEELHHYGIRSKTTGSNLSLLTESNIFQ